MLLYIQLLYNVCSSDFPLGGFYETEWRQDLMKRFFRGISSIGALKISQNRNIRTVCDGWEGIVCTEEDIKEVYYHSFGYGNFNIHTLPPTVVRVWITSCQQHFQIHTRSLPRRLKIISLSINEIYGQLDLTTLPESLELAYLWKNRMTGPILLINLPRSLQVLEIQQNLISQKVVFYDNLPTTLRDVFFGLQNGKKKIKEVRPINESQCIAEKRIFRGMHPDSVI